MSRERHQRVGEIFVEARRLQGDARARLLEERCAGDAGLRSEVESLLDSDTMVTPIDTPLSGIDLGAAADEAGVPERIGKFRILGVLGEGGMGVVYRAEQEQPRRVVALKIMRLTARGTAVLRRFEREAEALARLHHPGIAQVYEVGRAETPWGSCPYLAMELIDGPMVTEYVRTAAPGVRARLGLVALIADALHHAHTKGVIHRDLKPANILVEDVEKTSGREATGGEHETRFGSPVQPKLLDFGVARLADEGAGATFATDPGQLVGTLRYMSPEQVAGGAHTADVRSDVYALGLVGYELLTGRLPYDLDNKAMGDITRVIREVEPARPSVHTGGLAGDPEIILLKALEKDPARRYASAAEFAADIRRYLADQPISARPASAVYQLGKFARRNRALVAVAGTVVVALAVVAGVSLSAAVTSSRALKAEKAARDTAQREADKSRRALEFIRDMLAASHPGREGVDVRVVEVLDGFAKKVGETFKEQPEAEADVRHTIGAAYLALGRHADAREHLQRTVDLRSVNPGLDDVTTIDSRLLLCEALVALRAEKEAMPILEDVRQRRVGDVGEDDSRVLSAHNMIGQVYTLQRKPELAEREYRAALAIGGRIGSPDSTMGTTMVNLGTLLRNQGRAAEALDISEGALKLLEWSVGPDDPRTISARTYLALAESKLGKPELAIPRFLEALESSRRVRGPEHADTLILESNLGTAYMEAGRYEEAVPVLEHCYKGAASQEGVENPRTLTLANNLASAYQFVKEFEKALTLYATVLEAQTRIVGPDDQSTLTTRNNMARVLLKQKKLDEALAAFESLLKDAERVMPDHWAVSAFKLGYGQCLADMGRRDEAEPVLVGAAQALEKKLGKAHPYVTKAKEAVVNLYEAWGRPEEAAKFR